MHNALVLPYFTYCSTVWSDGRYTHIDKLSKLQKRAARVITGDKYEVRSIEIFDKLRWLPIDAILKNREIVFTFKALTKRLPKYIFELFNKCNNTNYNLRSNDILNYRYRNQKQISLKEAFHTEQPNAGTNYLMR